MIYKKSPAAIDLVIVPEFSLFPTQNNPLFLLACNRAHLDVHPVSKWQF